MRHMYLRRERRPKQTARGLGRVLPPPPQSSRSLLRSPLPLYPSADDLMESLLAGYSANDYLRKSAFLKLATAFNTVWPGLNNTNTDTETIDFFSKKQFYIYIANWQSWVTSPITASHSTGSLSIKMLIKNWIIV